MTETIINGIPVKFPFEPYGIQKDYMEKVIQCLQHETNGVLESPTGTGKTLSLLCSTLAWLELKKAQIQSQYRVPGQELQTQDNGYLNTIQKQLNTIAGGTKESVANMLNALNQNAGMPQIIYASRTHSQLSQAMQEMKQTHYNYMKASVLGSREQMCIHPEVSKESSATKVSMCRLKVQTRSCNYHNRVDRQKDNPAVCDQKIVDIEDLVKLGETHKFCPYYMSKELKSRADIIFMPYNYLLDPKIRKNLGITLSNNIIILDEAHNIEHICEDSASLQLKSSDTTLAIEEVTEVMKAMSDANNDFAQFTNTPPDFTGEELCTLKEILLNFENVMDEIEIKNSSEGVTFDGNYIFEMFAKSGIKDDNVNGILNLTDKIIQFLSTVNNGPFQRQGHGLKILDDLLRIAFFSSEPSFKQKIQKCYKVHLIVEEPSKYKSKTTNTWLSKAASKPGCKVLSYWCFSPGFGMNMLMDQGIKCVILTSGTLAPLNPLISELELKVGVRLENPHIVKSDQVCVKILGKGPDGEILNSSFQNRDNPKYIKSLGMTINNLARVIPNGLLIFFPSYPIMAKCKDKWQEDGLWSSINSQKLILVEPKEKVAFQEQMASYYQAVNDPKLKGAIFMGVCRGKVSEGLDFADANGRAVIITGLPFPPLKDPRIILKKRYLDVCRAKNSEYVGGNDWYSLQATKAVNQAIGRVIRHQKDYGAILLLDTRFNNPKIISQMSLWLRNHIKPANNYGEVVRELRSFFKEAAVKFPVGALKPLRPEIVPMNTEPVKPQKNFGMFEFSSYSNTSSLSSANQSSAGEIAINKRHGEYNEPTTKRKKLVLIPNPITVETTTASDTCTTLTDVKEYLAMVRKYLNIIDFQKFLTIIKNYRANADFDELCTNLDEIFISKYSLRYLIQGLGPYMKNQHKNDFEKYWGKMR